MSNAKDNFQFPIPNEVLEPYIKTAVSTAIVAALGDGTKLVEQAVQSALTSKVDSSGKVSNYSSDNKYPFVEVLTQNTIRDVSKKILMEMAEQMKPSLTKEVARQIKASNAKIAKSLIDGLTENIKCGFKVEIDVK